MKEKNTNKIENKKQKQNKKEKNSKIKNITNKEENKLPVKKETDIAIDKSQLEKIEEEIKNSKKNKKEQKKKRDYKDATINIIIALLAISYFFGLLISSKEISTITFITYLKTIIIVEVIATLAIFEKAYRKDKGTLAINGIEMLVIAGVTVFILDWVSKRNPYINTYIAIIIGTVASYYLIKILVIGIKKIRKKRVDTEEE